MKRYRLAAEESTIRCALTFLLCTWTLIAQDDYTRRVRPFLAQNCQSCHNDTVRMANLSLVDPGAKSPVWPAVLDKLQTGRMPPPGSPQPSATDSAFVRDWIARTASARVAAPETSRVTVHRLNRAEYNNTVRDLLGVTLRAADEFPLDDAGYGFDNIRDVLSVSPLLMEKYLAAARAVSQRAVYGAAVPAKPTKIIRLMTKKSQDDPTPRALPFSNRGALFGSFDFPATGFYELRMRIGNYRSRAGGSPRHRELSSKKGRTAAEQAELDELNRRAYPPVKMVLTFDGAPVLSEIVEGNVDYQYAHGEAVARVRATAGEHVFRASFPEFAGMQNPLDNVNLDGRRKLFIDYLDIVGPFEAVAEEPASRRRVFLCAERTAACATKIIETLATRAYRRPVTKADVAPLVKIAAMVRDSGDSFDESIRVALQAMLVSPNFLFRFETSDGYDKASRLAYFLWSSMPDDKLLAAAPELHKPAVLEREVRRMLADTKADALVENFAGQWLGLRLLDKRKPDPKVFPRVDDEVLEAMRQETVLFARAVLREDRSVLDFLDGRYSFVNGPLARHYGMAGVAGETFERVDLAGRERGGIAAHGSVLTLSSYATRTSPVLRGRWVLENLLGAAPPPAPPDIPALEEKGLGTSASLRERLEQHRKNPSCAVCHNQMDAIGFSLENYDAAGAWREKDGNFAIDSTGRLPGGESFEGPAGLRGYLRSQAPAFTRNLAEKMLTYALGRGLERADHVTLEEITRQVTTSGHRSSVLVLAIAQALVPPQGVSHATAP